MFYKIINNEIYCKSDNIESLSMYENILELQNINVEYFNNNIDKYMVEDGQITDISQTPEYIAEQVNILKNKALSNITNSYDYAINYGVFKLDESHYANMSWYNTWSKVVNIYKKSTALSAIFSTRLYIKENNIYKNTYQPNSSQGLDNMLTVLETQQFINYQPLRDSYINELLLHVSNQNIDGIKAIIELTKDNKGFGDTINEQQEIILNA